jgi:hypothetical protein
MSNNSRFRIDDVLDILSRTPKVLRLMLEGLPNDWLHSNEGENTWSPFDVLGHLIHGEKTDWVNRIQIIMNHGDTKIFDPVDRFAHLHKKKHNAIEILLDEFETIRNHIGQIVRVMAKNYHEEVGPWRAYLGILQSK